MPDGIVGTVQLDSEEIRDIRKDWGRDGGRRRSVRGHGGEKKVF